MQVQRNKVLKHSQAPGSAGRTPRLFVSIPEMNFVAVSTFTADNFLDICRLEDVGRADVFQVLDDHPHSSTVESAA